MKKSFLLFLFCTLGQLCFGLTHFYYKDDIIRIEDGTFDISVFTDNLKNYIIPEEIPSYMPRGGEKFWKEYYEERIGSVLEITGPRDTLLLNYFKKGFWLQQCDIETIERPFGQFCIGREFPFQILESRLDRDIVERIDKDSLKAVEIYDFDRKIVLFLERRKIRKIVLCFYIGENGEGPSEITWSGYPL